MLNTLNSALNSIIWWCLKFSMSKDVQACRVEQMHVGVRKGQAVAVAQAEPQPERQTKLSTRSYQRLN